MRRGHCTHSELTTSTPWKTSTSPALTPCLRKNCKSRPQVGKNRVDQATESARQDRLAKGPATRTSPPWVSIQSRTASAANVAGASAARSSVSWAALVVGTVGSGSMPAAHGLTNHRAKHRAHGGTSLFWYFERVQRKLKETKARLHHVVLLVRVHL